MPFPNRVGLVAAVLLTAAALALIAANRSRTPPAGRAPTPPTSTSGVKPPTTASDVEPPTSAGRSATTIAPDGPFAVGSATITLSARSGSGTAVTIPTSLWYPTSGLGGPDPLVIFSPGYQIAPAAYDPLTTAWAAAGYVVAEPTYPDTAPGAPPVEYDMVNHPGELSQVMTALIDDSAAGMAPIGGRIDPSEVAVAGQSDGGDVSLASAADSCCHDPRIKAAVILSGAEATLFGGSYYQAGSPPLLVVQGDADTVNPPGCSQQLYDGAPEPRYYLDLPSATHLSAYTAAGRMLSSVTAVTTAFLDGYVRSMPGRLAELPALGTVPGVATLTTGAAVPIAGGCPGAPSGG